MDSSLDFFVKQSGVTVLVSNRKPNCSSIVEVLTCGETFHGYQATQGCECTCVICHTLPPGRQNESAGRPVQPPQTYEKSHLRASLKRSPSSPRPASDLLSLCAARACFLSSSSSGCSLSHQNGSFPLEESNPDAEALPRVGGAGGGRARGGRQPFEQSGTFGCFAFRGGGAEEMEQGGDRRMQEWLKPDPSFSKR